MFLQRCLHKPDEWLHRQPQIDRVAAEARLEGAVCMLLLHPEPMGQETGLDERV